MCQCLCVNLCTFKIYKDQLFIDLLLNILGMSVIIVGNEVGLFKEGNIIKYSWSYQNIILQKAGYVTRAGFMLFQGGSRSIQYFNYTNFGFMTT